MVAHHSRDKIYNHTNTVSSPGLIAIVFRSSLLLDENIITNWYWLYHCCPFLSHICDGSGGAGNGACSDWMAMIAQSVIRPTAFFIRRWMDAKTQMTHSLLLNNLNYGVGSHPCEQASISARRSRGTSNGTWHTSLNKSCCRIFVMAVAEEWCMLWLNGDDRSVSQSTNRLFLSEMDGWCENTDDALTAKQSELHMGLAPIHASEHPLPLDIPQER